MEAWTRWNDRKATETTRQKPLARPVLRVALEGDGSEAFRDGVVPGEIHLEATEANGEVADWFEDYWWMQALERWQKHSVAVHILPTPRALLHPLVIHHLEMLHRVVPGWRRIGHCYVDDVLEQQDMRLLALSPYTEVRVIDAFRPGTGKSEAELREIKVEKLIGQVMRIQAEVGGVRPVLIRVPPPQVPQTGEVVCTAPDSRQQVCGGA